MKRSRMAAMQRNSDICLKAVCMAEGNAIVDLFRLQGGSREGRESRVDALLVIVALLGFPLSRKTSKFSEHHAFVLSEFNRFQLIGTRMGFLFSLGSLKIICMRRYYDFIHDSALFSAHVSRSSLIQMIFTFQLTEIS
jgi:hypothetical protein